MFIEVVIGPMFAGKSSYILSEVRRNQCIGLKSYIIKPDVDTRYSHVSEIITHNDDRVPCTTVTSLVRDVDSKMIHKCNLIVIEEAQFFPDLLDFVVLMEELFPEKHLMIVGLDGDSNRKPFGEILQIIPLADKVTKLTSVCAECKNGTPALFSHRRNGSDEQILVGGTNEYIPLCRRHYTEHNPC